MKFRAKEDVEMDKSLKEKIFLIAFGGALLGAVFNMEMLVSMIRQLGGLIFPVVLGLILAFVLNVPMRGLQKKLTALLSKTGKSPNPKMVNIVSLFLTLLCILLVIVLAVRLIVPELVTSINSAYDMFKEKWPELQVMLEDYDIDTEAVTAWMAGFDAENMLSKIINGAGFFATHIADFANTTVSGLTTAGIAFVIAVYVLLSKITLSRHSRKFCRAYLSRKNIERVYRISRLINDTYARFISGQCLEAVILGCLIFIAFCIFRLPYAGITAILTSIFAFVPYIGAFCACGIGALLTLLADPSKVFLCIIVYLAVQFIENHFIYPNVVGNSVGLSPLWTLIAVVAGGKLFGLLGMILFIPLAAVIYALVREDANKRILARVH